jgi:hypothetical protein
MSYELPSLRTEPIGLARDFLGTHTAELLRDAMPTENDGDA